MKELSCNEFRALLGRTLSQPGPYTAGAVQAEARVLSWNAHLSSCGECRALLAAEEALEELLSSLPDPHLPRDLADRVLRRLALERPRTGALDRLLELDTAPEPPAGLGQRVLGGLSRARAAGEQEAGQTEDRLEHLLELIPSDPGPSDLSQRLLAALGPERTATKKRPGLPSVQRAWGGLSRAAAVLLVVGGGLVLWRVFEGRGSDPGEAIRPADEEVIAALDVLERWEDLMGADIDILLAQLDPADLALIEADVEESDD